ncbi:hypothetical protein [Frigoriglobus tundricola]|uniref:Uncharacterized protein n=1 Tax=Frigoriglobus tundricola TaxID=2774151 RepID=A0A6M5YXN9_9BACT|nr:hypothetical protein [Frigoriglobus tundricola]QJW98877.1 hypothetical protein FTUN_6472 [Frigoriglobus tundricola]
MRPFARNLTAFSGAAALIAVGLFVVMEFGTLAEDSASLRYLTAEDQKWDDELELARGRETVSRDIATALCEDRITVTEAIDSVMSLAGDSPDWVAQLRSRYSRYGFVPPTATDRDVMTQYLRVHIESMKCSAESTDDRPRAALLSACLAHFADEGHTSLPAPPSHK